MKASIVIRTHNSEGTIGEVLGSIRSQFFRDYEVVIVDSGSTDGTLEIASRHPHRIVNYTQEEFTYSGALNAGISEARGEYIVCLSSHCVPLHQEWLGRLVGTLDADGRLAAAWGPWVFDVEDHAASGNTVEIIDLGKFFLNPTRGLQNSNGVIRRSLWERRPFSEEVERCEDQEWAHYFLRQGYRTAVVHGAPVHYRYPSGLFFAPKTYKNCLTTYDLFGYEGWRISTADLYTETRWFVRKLRSGEKSLHTSKLAIASRIGRWAASRVLERRKSRQGYAT